MNPDIKKRCWLALLAYAEGRSVQKACDSAPVSSRWFYDMVRFEPKFNEEYQALRTLRAHKLLDECEDILTDETDAKRLRTRIDCIIKVIAQQNPDRYGDRLKVQVEEKPSIRAALTAALARAQIPLRDLARDSDGTYRTIPSVEDQRAPDPQSGDRTISQALASAYVPPDPFE